MNDIIERIVLLLKENKITAKSLCIKLNISTNSISEWKSGKIKPSAEILINIAQYFNVSLDWLLLGYTTSKELKLDEDEIELIEYFRNLAYKEKYILLGELKNQVKASDKDSDKNKLSSSLKNKNNYIVPSHLSEVAQDIVS